MENVINLSLCGLSPRYSSILVLSGGQKECHGLYSCKALQNIMARSWKSWTEIRNKTIIFNSEVINFWCRLPRETWHLYILLSSNQLVTSTFGNIFTETQGSWKHPMLDSVDKAEGSNAIWDALKYVVRSPDDVQVQVSLPTGFTATSPGHPKWHSRLTEST